VAVLTLERDSTTEAAGRVAAEKEALAVWFAAEEEATKSAVAEGETKRTGRKRHSKTTAHTEAKNAKVSATDLIADLQMSPIFKRRSTDEVLAPPAPVVQDMTPPLPDMSAADLPERVVMDAVMQAPELEPSTDEVIAPPAPGVQDMTPPLPDMSAADLPERVVMDEVMQAPELEPSIDEVIAPPAPGVQDMTPPLPDMSAADLPERVVMDEVMQAPELEPSIDEEAAPPPPVVQDITSTLHLRFKGSSRFSPHVVRLSRVECTAAASLPPPRWPTLPGQAEPRQCCRHQRSGTFPGARGSMLVPCRSSPSLHLGVRRPPCV